MILACVCGRRFRAAEGASADGFGCPQCGGRLHPEGSALAPAVDLTVLLRQMQVLRDELVTRDRALRKALAELDQLRSRRPVAREEKPKSPLLELPSNRVALFTSRDP